ncbi:MAG: RNA 2',3'-cyclic phosphodiesterase [Alphaproteobacteria bacterium]|nr:RNA 2',3'-cyclic phosphodiesterase [Alphaproteobacteria bacterium]
MRLFVALPIPDQVAQGLLLMQGGVPGARWQGREQLHLTLRFIGEVDGRDARALDDALSGIDAPGLDLQLHGVGQFGNKQPHALWAAARPNPMLDHLQRKVDNAIRKVGQPQDSHKFTPHVTLARLRHPDLDKVREWLVTHALATSPEFAVNAFSLYSSKLTSDGSIYRVEQDYPLRGFSDEIGD